MSFLRERAAWLESRGHWVTDMAAHVIDLALIELKAGDLVAGERRIDVFNDWCRAEYARLDAYRDTRRRAA